MFAMYASENRGDPEQDRPSKQQEMYPRAHYFLGGAIPLNKNCTLNLLRITWPTDQRLLDGPASHRLHWLLLVDCCIFSLRLSSYFLTCFHVLAELLYFLSARSDYQDQELGSQGNSNKHLHSLIYSRTLHD